MLDQIVNSLTDIAVAVITGLITVATTYILSYIKKLKLKANEEIKKISNESVQSYTQSVLDRAESLLSISIDKIENSLVKELKSQTEDGKLSKSDFEKVANAAYEEFKSIASNELLDSLSKVVGDTKTFSLALIESLIIKKKATSKVVENLSNQELNS